MFPPAFCIFYGRELGDAVTVSPMPEPLPGAALRCSALLLLEKEVSSHLTSECGPLPQVSEAQRQLMEGSSYQLVLWTPLRTGKGSMKPTCLGFFVSGTEVRVLSSTFNIAW